MKITRIEWRASVDGKEYGIFIHPHNQYDIDMFLNRMRKTLEDLNNDGNNQKEP